MSELEKKLSTIIKACEDKKAFDIQSIDISKMSSIADYFVIVSGNSSTQVMSIADEVVDQMAELGFENIIKEGYHSGRWILMDFNDIIVHVFHKEEREFYNLERLWLHEKERNETN